MLEWMHDEESLQFFRFDTVHTTEEQADRFIANSFTDEERHYAVVNDHDEYLGTISLKKIDLQKKSAEYAVVFRKSERGTGAAEYATHEILRIAFYEIGLEEVYLHVIEDNLRAVRFYEKFGFQRCTGKDQIMTATGEKTICWFRFRKKDYLNCPSCRRFVFDVHGDERGQLVVVEGGKDIPFEIQRMFYIYGTAPGVSRGNHANRRSEFLLVCLNGSAVIDIDDGQNKDTVVLKDKNEALYMPCMVWKEMRDFSDDAVLLVMSSEKYDADEYIRDYDQFIKEVNVRE